MQESCLRKITQSIDSFPHYVYGREIGQESFKWRLKEKKNLSWYNYLLIIQYLPVRSVFSRQ